MQNLGMLLHGREANKDYLPHRRKKNLRGQEGKHRGFGNIKPSSLELHQFRNNTAYRTEALPAEL